MVDIWLFPPWFWSLGFHLQRTRSVYPDIPKVRLRLWCPYMHRKQTSDHYISFLINTSWNRPCHQLTGPPFSCDQPMESTDKPKPGADTHYWREEGTSGNHRREDSIEAGRHDQFKGSTFQNTSASNHMFPWLEIRHIRFWLLSHRKITKTFVKLRLHVFEVKSLSSVFYYLVGT